MLANLAMMNVAQDAVEWLSLWEYEALVWNWNEAHRTGDDVEPPEAEATQALLDKINADPRLTGRVLEPA